MADADAGAGADEDCGAWIREILEKCERWEADTTVAEGALAEVASILSDPVPRADFDMHVLRIAMGLFSPDLRVPDVVARASRALALERSHLSLALERYASAVGSRGLHALVRGGGAAGAGSDREDGACPLCEPAGACADREHAATSSAVRDYFQFDAWLARELAAVRSGAAGGTFDAYAKYLLVREPGGIATRAYGALADARARIRSFAERC